MIRSILVVLILAAPIAAQEGDRTSKVRKATVPGYTIKTIEGFTVLVSDETMKHAEDEEYERQPIAVLEYQLKLLVEMMPGRITKLLQTVPIWVEWNESRAMSNGRQGEPVAVYLGGHQLSLLSSGENPLKAKSVVILRMKRITESTQPGKERGLVVLHELAHAVHNELLGRSNAAINSAYKQAMERKLYDSDAYVSTNQMEFFAELTCSYFSQLPYHPRTREQLARHDKVTYDLMKSVWGEKSLDGIVSPGLNSEFDLDVRLAAVDFGEHAHGPNFTVDDAAGEPIVVVLWNANNTDSVSSLARLTAWHRELSGLGLRVVAVHRRGVDDSSDPVGTARARELPFTVTDSTWRGQLIKDYGKFPHCLVFGADGECDFRGSPFEAEEAVRATVGEAIVARIGIEQFSDKLAPVVDAIRKGKPTTVIFPHLTFHSRSSDEATATQAKALMAEFSKPGLAAMKEAVTLASSDPVGAYLALEEIPQRYEGTPLAGQASALLKKLQSSQDVRTELRARKVLDLVRKIDTELSSRPGAFDPSQPKFRQANAPLLLQLGQHAQQLKQKWPDTRAAAEAEKSAARWGVFQ